MADEPAGPIRRRRRRKATRAQGAPDTSPPAATAPSTSTSTPTTAPAAAEPVERAAPPRRRRPQPAERGLRDLVGAGHSQLGVSGALRARDVNRPTDADLAAAEQELVIVRRNWRPSDTPSKSG
jgi:predicted flap endonuclease-1-like 5' DNA nuclease